MSSESAGKVRASTLTEPDALEQSIAELSPALLWMSDAAGRCVYLNKAQREFWGVAIDEMPDFDWSGTLLAEDVQALALPLQAGMAEQKAFEATARYRRTDGAIRHLQTTAHPRFDAASGRFLGMVGVNVDITDRIEAQQALSEGERRKDAILNSALDAIVTVDHSGHFLEFNPAAEAMFGYDRDAIIGELMKTRIIPERLRDMHRDGMNRFLATGESRVLDQRLELPALRSDGSEFPVEIAIVRIAGVEPPVFTAYLRDISEKKNAEKRSEMLIGELNHRTKNILTVVQAVARQTARHSSPEGFLTAFLDRVSALAASNDLLVESNWSGVSLDEMVPAQLKHLQDILGSRVVFSGPPVVVLPASAQSLSMALHELSTNSIKYGALSNPDGWVEIRWDVSEAEPEPHFSMSWVESGGPRPVKPERSGFGSVVITDMLTAALSAEVTIDYAPSGLRWSLAAPAGRVLDLAGA